MITFFEFVLSENSVPIIRSLSTASDVAPERFIGLVLPSVST